MSVCGLEAYRRLCGPQNTQDVCATFEGLCENGRCIPTPDGSFRCECEPGYKSTGQPTQCAGTSLLAALSTLSINTDGSGGLSNTYRPMVL